MQWTHIFAISFCQYQFSMVRARVVSLRIGLAGLGLGIGLGLGNG